MGALVLILSIIIIHTFNSVEAVDDTACQSNEPKNCWESYIVPYFNTKTYCCKMLKNVDIKERSKLKKSCQKKIKPYFQSNVETEFFVRMFAEYCESKMKENWNRCADVIYHFSKPSLCWDMCKALDLLEIFHKNNFLADTELRKIKFSYSDFIYFKDAHIYLKRSSAFAIAVENSLENTMDLLYCYKETRDDFIKKNNYKSVACDIEQIIGIYKFYCKRKTFQSNRHEKKEFALKNLTAEEKNELTDLYRETCLGNKNESLKDQWKTDKLEILTENAKDISFKIFKVLIVDGWKLPSAGWFTPNIVETQWPVDFVLPKIIQKESKEIDTDAIETISLAIGVRFTPEIQKEYLRLLSEYDGFNSSKCQNNILNAVKNEIDVPSNRINFNFWIKHNNKQDFIKHLKILLDFYQNSQQVRSCEDFIKTFITIESVFYYYNWTAGHMNSLITIAINSGMVMKEFNKCLKLVKNIYDSFDMIKPLEENSDKTNHLWPDWKPNEIQREHFRVKLFSNRDKAKPVCALEGKNVDKVKVFAKLLDWDFPANSTYTNVNYPPEVLRERKQEN